MVVVGRQATLHVVVCDTAENFSLISFLHHLQKFETSHSIDAGHTVTCLVHGHELVDSLKPALVHDDRPIADPCLDRHSSLGNCDHDRPPGEKWHKRRDQTLFNQCQKFRRTQVRHQQDDDDRK